MEKYKIKENRTLGANECLSGKPWFRRKLALRFPAQLNYTHTRPAPKQQFDADFLTFAIGN